MSEWLILELKEKAEGEDPDLIRSFIRRRIKDPSAEVFIPVSITKIGKEKILRTLVDGYAFIKRTRPDKVYMGLFDSAYIETLVCTGSKLSTVGDKEIDRLRSQVHQDDCDNKPEVGVGDKVLVTAGTYESIEGTVERGPLGDGNDIGDGNDMVQVFVKLRSTQRSIMVPRACLQSLERLNPAQTGGPLIPVLVSVPAGPSAMITALCARFREKSQQWASKIPWMGPPIPSGVARAL